MCYLFSTIYKLCLVFLSTQNLLLRNFIFLIDAIDNLYQGRKLGFQIYLKKDPVGAEKKVYVFILLLFMHLPASATNQ